MGRPYSIEELSKKCNNVYALVRTLAARSVEISRGAPPLLLKPSSNNPVSIAIEEVMSEKVIVKTEVVAYLKEEA